MNAERKEELKNLINTCENEIVPWAKNYSATELHTVIVSLTELTKELLAEPLTPNERSLIWEQENKQVALSSAEYWLNDYLTYEKYDGEKERKFLESLTDEQKKEVAEKFTEDWDMGESPFDDEDKWQEIISDYIEDNIDYWEETEGE